MLVISDSAAAAAPHYNETEIRFHVIDPVIRMLGYPNTENTYLNLEEKLEYPYLHIGRRSKRDVPLGYPDYRAGVKGARGSFVVEAKAGNVPITAKEVEQAHSYAAHAQVGANYFMLGNGSELVVYETLSGPDATPIVRLPLDSLNARFFELENVLSPTNLARNCRVEYDRKLRLADCLGSYARVRSGRYLHSEYDLRFVVNGQDCTPMVRQSVPQFAEVEAQLELVKSSFEMRVSDGFVERGDDGKIVAHFEFSGITVHNHAAMAIMGIDKATFATADEFLSTDPKSPTIFESLTDFMVYRGTSLPQLFGEAIEMEGDILGSMFVRVAMHYSESVICGEYIAFTDQDVSIPGQIPFRLELDMAGTFELQIDT
ncbi:MAG: type I restriction enzyme HsdR N-terminal domain-containing protein [Paracoccaceae bacterium]